MVKHVRVWLWVACLLVVIGGSASAAGKVLAVATTDADLVTTFLQNAGEKPSDYTVVSSLDQLEKAWAQRDQYGVLTFSYHGFLNDAGLVDFFTKHGQEVVDWVKAGGGIFLTTRDDPQDNTIPSLFDVHYTGGGATASTFDIKDAAHPVFNDTYKIDTKALEAAISAAPDVSLVDAGVASNNPAIKVIATMPGSDDPALVAGQIGKGKVVFGGVEFFWHDYTQVEQDLHLISNIIHWLQQ
ncbi:MAG TPA: hypothetical protein VFK80_01565 [Limnochordia bacterium]|nr:hypothetical protein [Limnochordia bacterium]